LILSYSLHLEPVGPFRATGIAPRTRSSALEAVRAAPSLRQAPKRVVAVAVQHKILALVQTVETVDNLQLMVQLPTEEAEAQALLAVLEV